MGCTSNHRSVAGSNEHLIVPLLYGLGPLLSRSHGYYRYDLVLSRYDGDHVRDICLVEPDTYLEPKMHIQDFTFQTLQCIGVSLHSRRDFVSAKTRNLSSH